MDTQSLRPGLALSPAAGDLHSQISTSLATRAHANVRCCKFVKNQMRLMDVVSAWATAEQAAPFTFKFLPLLRSERQPEMFLSCH
eukprot:1159973-Pelagomonas_calceolata.AAC.17